MRRVDEDAEKCAFRLFLREEETAPDCFIVFSELMKGWAILCEDEYGER